MPGLELHLPAGTVIQDDNNSNGLSWEDMQTSVRDQV
jgi:hypothetical protein